MKSNRTKTSKRAYKFCAMLSWMLCFGTTAFLIVFMLTGKKTDGNGSSLKITDIIGSAVYSFILTNIPLIVLSIVVKDKIKPLIWMMNVIMANVVFGSVAIYIIFAIWLAETYIITPLKDKYKRRWEINREIDLRDEERD